MTFVNDTTLSVKKKILEEVLKERQRQDDTWGYPQMHKLPGWLVILLEEAGEAAQACRNNDIKQVRKELIEVAAVALATIEHMDAGHVRNNVSFRIRGKSECQELY